MLVTVPVAGTTVSDSDIIDGNIDAIPSPNTKVPTHSATGASRPASNRTSAVAAITWSTTSIELASYRRAIGTDATRPIANAARNAAPRYVTVAPRPSPRSVPYR